MKLVRYAWWPLVLVISIAAWWAVAYWLEPKPLWVIPEGEQVYVSSYDPVLKRLGVYQRFSLSDSTGQMIILDAPTGNCIAKKTIRIEPWLEHRPEVDVTPRLGKNDTYWRFTQERKGDGSSELQLRCWSYLKSTEEDIIASWPIPSTKGLEERNPMRVPLTAAWLPGEPDCFVVSHTLPTQRLIHTAASFLVPNIFAESPSDIHFWERTLVKCDVWHIDHAHRSAALTNTYLAPFAHRPLHYQERWDKDRIHHITVKGNYSREPSLLWINSLTGKIDREFLLEKGGHVSFDFQQSTLLLVRRQQLSQAIVNGQLMYLSNPTPGKLKPENWSLDVWRPLLDPVTWKPILWPAELDIGIVGDDIVLDNQLDPTRMVYRSQVYESNPLWKSSTAKTTTKFVFLRYTNGQLSLEKQWHQESWMNCFPCVYTDQLFVQGAHPADQRPWPQYLMEKFPTWGKWYQTKIVKMGSSYVAAVDIDTGKVLWKRTEREFDNNLPQLGTDFMLVKFKQNGANEATGYECYSLPMKIYSPWWAHGVAAFILLIAACYSLRRRKSSSLPTGSPA